MLDIDRQYIMDCLKKMGWSVSELASRAGISRTSAYSCLLHGHMMRTEMAIKCADALTMKPENILIQKQRKASKWFDIDLVKLECARVREELTMGELARQAGISAQGLSLIYKRGWCTQGTAEKLAEVLYLTVFELHRKNF